jgi:hypothetical protein
LSINQVYILHPQFSWQNQGKKSFRLLKNSQKTAPLFSYICAKFP